jgi:hypothetical protein
MTGYSHANATSCSRVKYLAALVRSPKGKLLRVLNTGQIQVYVQLRPVKMILAHLRYVADLVNRGRPEPRKILKAKKILPVSNPQPEAPWRDIEDFNL